MNREDRARSSEFQAALEELQRDYEMAVERARDPRLVKDTESRGELERLAERKRLEIEAYLKGQP